MKIREDRLKKKIYKNGSTLFKKYNYYILIFVFVLFYITINVYSYLNNLNNSFGEYSNFLQNVFYGGLTVSICLGILYGYAILSYTFYPIELKDKKREIIDPLIINFAYFVILSIELYFKKEFEVVLFTGMVAFIPLIAFLYLRNEKVILKVKSYSNIILKTLFFSVVAFFIIHFHHVVFSFQLINNDLKNKLEYKMNEVVGEQREKIIAKFIEKVNDKKISNKEVLVYLDNNKTHIVIQKNSK